MRIRSGCSRENLAAGWEFATEVLVAAPYDALIHRVPRVLGDALEAVDDTTTRLVGTTSNPRWYAERLATLPADFRVLGGPELRETTQGRRPTPGGGDRRPLTSCPSAVRPGRDPVMP